MKRNIGRLFNHGDPKLLQELELLYRLLTEIFVKLEELETRVRKLENP